MLTANIIAENLLAQVDEDGHRQLLMDEIIYHRMNTDAFQNIGVKTQEMKTMKGWDLCVYSRKMCKIDGMPAFRWWVPHTLKKANHIISKVKRKCWKRTHKYGIRVPKSAIEAYAIDTENGETYWTDMSSMKKIKGPAKVYDGDVTN